MSVNVQKELAALQRMTVGQLRERYAEVHGEQSRSFHKEFLVRRIIWRLQAIDDAEGMGAEVNHGTVMHPVAAGDMLKIILINMDSSVWMNYRASLGSSTTAVHGLEAENTVLNSLAASGTLRARFNRSSQLACLCPSQGCTCTYKVPNTCRTMTRMRKSTRVLPRFSADDVSFGGSSR